MNGEDIIKNYCCSYNYLSNEERKINKLPVVTDGFHYFILREKYLEFKKGTLLK